MAITPDGKRALVNNFGTETGSDGNADSVTVIELTNSPARVVQHLTVGDAPEGLALSQKGGFAAVSLLQGSYDAPRGAWFRHDTGRVAVLKLAAGGVSAAFPRASECRRTVDTSMPVISRTARSRF